ncbi:alpha/beta hydrolase family protein [Paraburkholderia terrae]|uniref:hypothetical protein n=1 Tax=Paraburkholderia terrae TaxID=311230 RepID=UPI00296B060E|nr:hypothetical protein [Paraburkholderia terrae]MDW3663754.1 hypothetical protein [Paraburkholderia terrae]
MRWPWTVAAYVILTGNVAMLFGCASTDQTQSEVYRRESGGKLEPWKSVSEASEIHWPYAWAAVAAYQDSDDPKRNPLETSTACPEPHVYLSQRGWVQWKQMPSLKPRIGEGYPAAAREMRDIHLRAEVWSNKETKQVVVAFGGTAASSMDDWKANFRWIFALFESKDEYTVLTDTFVPSFVAEYLRLEKSPEWAWLKYARVVSTGHSLGGGLSQRFAYSLQAKSGVPIVKEVYAFDPSPVSGKRSSPNFSEQANGLTIYRIYNRGETLASLRSLLHFGNPADRRNQGQTWIDIRYRDNWSWKTLLPSGSVHAHGMYDLARFMAKNLSQPDLRACLDT